MMVLDRGAGGVRHLRVDDLPGLLSPRDLLVVNDTRVMPARMRGRRATGGRVEILMLHPVSADLPRSPWRVLLRPAARVRAGERLMLEDSAGEARMSREARADSLVVSAKHAGGEADVVLEGPAFEAGGARAVMARYGSVPLPPYIRQPLSDPDRYQTVYAATDGSAAAPTAGLHFTPELLARLEAAAVPRATLTLHVGLGTFRPVQSDDPLQHPMHAEWIEVGAACADAVAAAHGRGGRVIAVGTTVVRALESCADGQGGVRSGSGWTSLYILPGRQFGVVDGMLTNFHLPRSTLLMMVCAFAGRERVIAAYQEAVCAGYRFFSFGDAMLLV